MLREKRIMGLGKKSAYRGLFWALRIALCVGSTHAAANEVEYATTLPQKAHHHAKKPKRKTKATSSAAHGRTMVASDFAPELQEEARANPFASKFYSRTVYYVRSTEPVPEEYNCDTEKESQKLGEAEQQAQDKCNAAGGDSCHLAKSVIAKAGVLNCNDFPSHRCPGSGHFRGCVAEALVLGGTG